MSKIDPEDSSVDSDIYDASPPVDPTPTTYITLETTDGQLEPVKVKPEKSWWILFVWEPT